jgi:hypothetical protein
VCVSVSECVCVCVCVCVFLYPILYTLHQTLLNKVETTTRQPHTQNPILYTPNPEPKYLSTSVKAATPIQSIPAQRDRGRASECLYARTQAHGTWMNGCSLAYDGSLGLGLRGRGLAFLGRRVHGRMEGWMVACVSYTDGRGRAIEARDREVGHA